jgi:hypothetical protein
MFYKLFPDFVSGISPSTSDLFGMNSTDPDADQDWNFDPSEPRYCICNQVSYGEMVACDNQDVSVGNLKFF